MLSLVFGVFRILVVLVLLVLGFSYWLNLLVGFGETIAFGIFVFSGSGAVFLGSFIIFCILVVILVIVLIFVLVLLVLSFRYWLNFNLLGGF